MKKNEEAGYESKEPVPASTNKIRFGKKAAYFGRGLLVGILIALAGYVGLRVYVHGEAAKLLQLSKPSGYRVVDVFSESLDEIGELYVMDYSYTILNSTKDPKTLFGKELPFGAKEMQYLYSGDLRVGVDLSTATVNEKNGTITITFPNMIAHNTFDENSIQIFDYKNYIFTGAALEHFQNMRVESIDDVKRKAEAAGTYEKALTSLEQMMESHLTSIIKSTGVEDEYQIEVVVESPDIVFSAS